MIWFSHLIHALERDFSALKIQYTLNSEFSIWIEFRSCNETATYRHSHMLNKYSPIGYHKRLQIFSVTFKIIYTTFLTVT